MPAEDLPDIESQLDALLDEAGAGDDAPNEADGSGGVGDDPARPGGAAQGRDGALAGDIDRMIADGRAAVAQAGDGSGDGEVESDGAGGGESGETADADEAAADLRLGGSAGQDDDALPGDFDTVDDVVEPEALSELNGVPPPPDAKEASGRDAEAEAAADLEAGLGAEMDDEILGDIQSLDEALDEMVEQELRAADDEADTASEPADEAIGKPRGNAGDEDDWRPDGHEAAVPAEAGQTAAGRDVQPPGEIRLPASSDPEYFESADDIDELDFEDPDEVEASARRVGTAAAVGDELDADADQQRGHGRRSRGEATDKDDERGRRTLVQLVAAVAVSVLAVFNRPVRYLPPQTRDLVGFIGVQTLFVSLGLLSFVAWGAVAATYVACAGLVTVGGAVFYFLFVRRREGNFE